MSYRFILNVVAAISFVGAQACSTPAPKADAPTPLAISDDIDAFVEAAIEELGIVPGFSLAVYTPEGVYTRGFGVTDVNTGEPVTSDTAFYIASSTKSFTSLAMNTLHHRGEINLDATLNEFAPDASFSDAVLPGQVILRDLLTHTSGIENFPISWRAAYSGEHTPQINWRLLSSSVVNEEAPYGEFQYTNTGYNILTIMSDAKLGVNWQDLIAREIIEPAGMTRTTAYMSKAKNEGWSLAKPHFTGFKSGPVRVELEKTDATMQSAGGMVMSANDSLLWLELFINDGMVGGKQIIPADVVKETREPLAIVGGDYRDYKRDHYGLGWYIGPYNDDLLVHHFGGFAGFRAHVSYMPNRKIGVAAFINDDVAGHPFPDVVANFIYDRLAGRDDAWETAQQSLAQLVERRDRIFKGIAADRERRAAREWLLSLPKEAYAGTYIASLYGTILVDVTDDDMRVSMGNLHTVAEPFTKPDTIRVELVPYSGDVLQFIVENGVAVAIMDRDGARYIRQ